MTVLRGVFGTAGVLLGTAFVIWKVRRRTRRGLNRKGKQVRKQSRKVSKGVRKRL